ncbi:MAG: outer membrane beta-barrel protein [Bacteroidales bacterium]|jgi:hypothetical protein|nr:outer membrane beta-barrel protein [Bacteroidales bacterium]
MNKFDDIFSRKAKEAFDNYNADHLADKGWNSFSGKYGRRRSRAILIPLWARAASIAILVTAGVLLTARLNNRKAGETVNQIAQETGIEQADSLMNKEDSASYVPGISAGKPVIIAANPEISATAETTGATSSIHDATSETAEVKPSIQTVTQELTARAQEPPSDQPASAHGISDGLTSAASPVKIRLADMADAGLKLKPGEAPKLYGDIPREKLTTTIMTGLSGMMATVGNATSASQGVSIGFYVEQQLTRRISVRPGLAMARHNYSVESMSGGSLNMAYAAPELNGMAATATIYDADMDVVSMEVPVNFVFSLRKRARSNLFVTTGASTVIYLSQNLSGSFYNTYTRSVIDNYTGNVSYESMTTSVEIESEQETLNRVDLLGLANFSAGYSFPFSGTSQLLFEPFVQMPIRDLTSLNLRIWYGGLSMKIRF